MPSMNTNILKPDWVYHYTGTSALRKIIRDGVIRAGRTRLYRDLLMTEVARDTEPIVWLSVNPMLEMTTAVKLGVEGKGLIGSIARIALPYGYADDVGLGEYTEALGVPHEDWLWNIKTGDMAGSHYTTWRIVTHDIPVADWHHIEWLSGIDDSGFRWEPWPHV